MRRKLTPRGKERREQLMTCAARLFAEHREYFAIIQFAATDETFAPVLARNREISIADTIRHLKDGIVDGRIVDRDPEMLAHAIHGVVAELTRHYLIERDEPVDAIADLCVAFCLEGLQ